MFSLIIAVLALLSVTRLFRPDEIKCQISFKVSWLCLIASLCLSAIQQFSLIWSGRNVLRPTQFSSYNFGIVLSTLVLVALIAALCFWHVALSANQKQNQQE